jgi:hypothetical protein
MRKSELYANNNSAMLSVIRFKFGDS